MILGYVISIVEHRIQDRTSTRKGPVRWSNEESMFEGGAGQATPILFCVTALGKFPPCLIPTETKLLAQQGLGPQVGFTFGLLS